MFFLGLFKSLGHGDSLHLLLPLFLELDAALLHVITLDDFVVPEALDFFLFILLGPSQVFRHLLEVERAIGLVAISHKLVLHHLVALLDLELEVRDGLRSQVHRNRGLVRLVIEVPNVDSIVFGNEDNTWACGRESTARVLGTSCVSRSEDGLIAVIHCDLPDCEVEVVHS